MATTVRYHHGMHFCSDLDSGHVTCDGFSERGVEFPSAPELLMVSLGSCIGAVLITYCERHAINYEGLTINLDWEVAEQPHRIGRIAVQVLLPDALSPEQMQTLERVSHQCLIHNTLLHPPQIDLHLETMQDRSKP